MDKNALFEVCAFTIQSCIIAERCGAARIELCDNPVEGGTTPSYGTIRRARERVSIRLYPIIRPRSGNYYYNEEELSIIKEDISICRQLGCDGISIGVQKKDGTINKDQLSRFVEWAFPMGVTCNRAFDAAPDPFQALEDIVGAGCERILTSGQKSTAPEGVPLLRRLVQEAGDRIIIMPGAGINASNVLDLKNETGATEFHGSLRKADKDEVSYHNPYILDAGAVYITDESELKKLLEALRGPGCTVN